MVRWFLDWWLAELTALIPGALRRRARRRGHALCIAVEPNRVHVSRRTNARMRALGEAPLGADGEPAPADCARLQALTAGLRPDRTLCEITAAPALTLVKEVELPAAAQENLRQVLGFEMQQLTPFSVEEAYYDYSVMERRDGKLRVRLAVVPRRIVDRATGWLAGWELRPAPASLSGSGSRPPFDAGGPLTLDFRGPSHREPYTVRYRTVLLALNVALAGAAVTIPLVHEPRHLEGLEARMVEARSAAEAALEIGHEVERLRTEARFLAHRASARTSTVLLLEELSVRLPDTTWVFRLELRDATVHLHGTSAAESSLIATLEDSEALTDVRFASPVLREGNTGRDRFHITAQLVLPRGGG